MASLLPEDMVRYNGVPSYIICEVCGMKFTCQLTNDGTCKFKKSLEMNHNKVYCTCCNCVEETIGNIGSVIITSNICSKSKIDEYNPSRLNNILTGSYWK